MLRKRADRRAAKHRHQDDIVFESGHAIYTDELRLHRSGIRGRKSVVLAIAFGIVFVLAIGNLVVSVCVCVRVCVRECAHARLWPLLKLLVAKTVH
jgi:hypothetical protein